MLRTRLPLALVPLLVAATALWPRGGGPVSTPFADARPLTAPEDRPGFHFAILGDRTGGPEEGIEVLRQAVTELRHLDPDFVMTVGDLINGYNREAEWLAQMEEYRATMDALELPWYPVAGNHDVYGDRGDPGDRSNEARYLQHFGPLYYSFDHRFAHFVVLYSDEQLSFHDPATDQTMSAEQLAWLEQDLAATSARHVFVFLHHPRWNYEGDPWAPVHQVLAASGKVRAVFAGHWHRYRSDGERDGVRYYTMAATGANIGPLSQAGQFHHYNLVSVREDGWSMGVLPVGAVWDPDFVTGAESEDCLALQDQDWLALEGAATFHPTAPTESTVTLRLRNPAQREVAFRYRWSEGSHFRFRPAQGELRVAPGQETTYPVVVRMEPLRQPTAVEPPELSVTVSYEVSGGGHQDITRTAALDVEYPPLPEELCADVPGDPDQALALDGRTAVLRIPDHDLLDPDGPFTAECWVRADQLKGRTGLINKTEQSSWGLFLRPGAGDGPSFSVFLTGEGYSTAQGAVDAVPLEQWVHVAGVFDGTDTRLYLGGRLLGASRLPGRLSGNNLPLLVGADVGRAGRANSFLAGAVDEVRLSRGARYQEDFEPARRFSADPDTILLLHLDRVYANRTPDCSGHGLHGELEGGARLVPRDAEEGGP